MTNKQVLIIGTGLIGSSLALCIKEVHPEIKILGFSNKESELVGAKSHHIIDDFSLNLEEVVAKADVIFFCTPVSVTLNLMEKISRFSLKKDVLLTDVGSTKKEILKKSEIFTKKGYTFIGGHPMAGSHKSGLLAADKDLFENAFYILVNEDKQQTKEIAELKELLKGTRAKFTELSANEHDQITGVLSHMPHIIASQLVEQAEELIQEIPASKKLAAGGFRDITRIASSDPKMWTDISMSNAEVLITEIDKWLANLGNLKDKLISKNSSEIFTFFEEAKKVRDDIPVHQEGTIPSFHDLYVNVPDYPGAIAEVTTILANERISLINIKIMETRDDIFGILCISFKSEKELMKAKHAVTSQTNYQVVEE